MHYSNFTLCLGKEEIDTTTKASLLYAVPLPGQQSLPLPTPLPYANILGDSSNNGQQSPCTVVPLLSSHQPCPFDHPHPNLD